MAATEGERPIIVKKIKKGEHAHHGGAWKVAYADFVTAMMAFFLLLWLLNVTTDEQKKGVADYFSPASVSRSLSGAGGVLGGRTIIEDGGKISSFGLPTMIVGPSSEKSDQPDQPQYDQKYEDSRQPPPAQGLQGDSFPDPADANRGERQESQMGAIDPQQIDALTARERLQQLEADNFREVEMQIRQAIQSNPQLAELSRQIVFDNTPEGFRIQLVDEEQSSMFPSGSSQMTEKARRLMQQVAQAVSKLPNKLAVSGHTDALPFRGQGAYSNWELSADRANAARRVMIESGVPAERFRQVTGNADQDPMIKDNPLDPRNRRIAILLLTDVPAGGAAPGNPSSQGPGGGMRPGVLRAPAPPPPPPPGLNGPEPGSGGIRILPAR
ncbi:MAG TPA: flagellar motor protein MotB [Ferrovibrio sp.]|jgi:chemotaxis protein MotB|uniref:flagellar motor protein MotB n=1 Tax=Ferrovibrio sp. TaxID=1917215 RepID=UPI002B4B0270|nr:flagellar motor protein MotB [Ferrovibrio sp.]HLT76963.1 flagellar motor protein MotB [Ferrovibrio sp.]